MDGFIIKINDLYKHEVEYVCDVIFNQFLDTPYIVEWSQDVNDSYYIESHQSSISFPNILFATPRQHWLKQPSFPVLPLLHVNNIDGSFFQSVPVLYGHMTPDKGVACIDILGSIFFMLTRYEEIDSETKDNFGRYMHENSILYKANLLRRPLVNEYLEILKERIRRIAPEANFKKHNYRVSISHDVDVPITFNASWWDVIKKSLGDLRFRKSPVLMLKRYFGKAMHILAGSYTYDPNNNFEFIMDEEENAGLIGLFNFIPIPGNGIYDSTYHIDSPVLKHILKKISDRGFEIGFHPGYDSYIDKVRTEKELHWLNHALEDLLISPAIKGRQHYLRWVNPITWRIWDEIGMKEDSSVGYGEINGFRAGCCYKYTVFDLQMRKHLQLIEEPLIVMDVNSDVNANDPAILSEVEYFHKICRFFNGNFTLLYHNNYIISKAQKRTFKKILKLIS